MPKVGDILVGRYRIDAPLGAGGSAMVYRAHDLRLRRDVALKILLPNLAQDPAVAHRFDREARSLAAVNHPGIVAVYDVEAGDRRTEREPFFVMELCERGSLADLLVARGGRLPPDEVVPTIVDVAGGLMSLHARGFVHRDVKPHNILLTPGGAKLGDFGIARGGDSTSDLTAAGTAVGTLAYLAPELLSGGVATPAADVFALGVVVYQALTGQLPRPAGTVVEFVNAQSRPIPPPSEVRPELGPQFDAPISAALHPDPAARPSPIQLAGALKAALADARRSGRVAAGWGRPATGTTSGMDSDGADEAAALAIPAGSATRVAGAVGTDTARTVAAPATDGARTGTGREEDRRRVRLAPRDAALPAAARTASVRVRPARRAPDPDWLPRRERGWVAPAIAALLGLVLVGLVAFALADGFRLFGLGAPRQTAAPSGRPSASAAPSATVPSPSSSAPPSPTDTASPSPSPSPSPSVSPTPSPTPEPTLPPSPTALNTPPRITDPTAALAALGNIETAVENIAAQGGVEEDIAEELLIRTEGIRADVRNRDYEDAAEAAAELEARIDDLIESGELTNSAELLGEVGKLRSALPAD